MKDVKKILAVAAFFASLAAFAVGEVEVVKSVTAQQRYPWNGLVDITVTLQGTAEEPLVTECSFAATNSATKAEILVEHVTRNGKDSGSDNTWTLKFIWDAKADVGAVKIDDVALTVEAKPIGVQLWENGPYWAECNVGAAKPEEYGYYFWWGDTVGYKLNASNNGWVSVKDGSSYHFSNCPTYGKNNSQLQSEGYIDATGNLVAAHDAATAHLGAPWRMPTDAEFSALINNCDTEWTSRNGVSGRLVKGRGAYASKSIFLPAAGEGGGSSLVSLGLFGDYWSSTSYSDYFLNAWYLFFNSGDFRRDYDIRYYGKSVRPVRGFANESAILFCAVSTHLSIDSRGAKVADSDNPIVYDASWYADGVKAKIAADGESIVSGAAGTIVWTPATDGVHFLTLKVSNEAGDVVGEESVWCLSREDLTELVIPEGTTEIGAFAFQGGRFTSVTIPNSVTNIGANAFAGCTNLQRVDASSISDWLKIRFASETSNPLWNGAALYVDGKEVTELVIHDGTTEIGAFAFQGGRFTSVTIPNSVTNVGANAFAGCTNLKRVDVPSMEAWLAIRFANETANPLWNGAALYVGGKEVTELEIPEGSAVIGAYAFQGGRFTSVTIPNSVTNIAPTAFAGCANIISVSLGNGVVQAGSASFGLLQKRFDTYFDTTSPVIGDVDVVSGVLPAYVKIASDSAAKTTPFVDPVTGRQYYFNSQNTTFAYSGYMWMEEGRTYSFGVSYDDGAYVKVEDVELLNVDVGGSLKTASYVCNWGGWHQVEFRVGDISGAKGPWGDYGWSESFGLGYRDDGLTTRTESQWKKLMDPGDGSLFRTKVVASLRRIFPDSFENIRTLELLDGTRSILSALCDGCVSLETVTIPNSVTNVGANAFAGCTNLQRVNVSSFADWLKIRFANEKANPLWNGAALYVDGKEVKDLMIP